eukprot:comp19259_c0_seq1/m.22058 comp19259_c0_seq1/g.22058  ORF comp19259_c0_seq1/g.22058 comp19259_c0_seq1/m.22058 type:complete len:125 (-) comp19259_c0_seq1:687-1061(-)
MAARVAAQVLIYGTQVVTRAFMDAYRQAAANAGKHASATAAGASRAATKDFVHGGMALAEARQILNVTEDMAWDKVLKHYEHLYKMNEKATGGSFYLQSKVVRAREALEVHMRQMQQQAAAASQ